MPCQVIHAEVVNAARTARQLQQHCISIIENWERVLYLIDTRIQGVGTWPDADVTAIEQAMRELAVVRDNVTAALASVRAVRARSRNRYRVMSSWLRRTGPVPRTASS
jgi:hypothetical protein